MENLNKIMEEKGLSEDDIVEMLNSDDKEEQEEKEPAEEKESQVESEEPKEAEKEESEDEPNIKELIKEEIRNQLKAERSEPPKGDKSEDGVQSSLTNKKDFGIYV